MGLATGRRQSPFNSILGGLLKRSGLLIAVALAGLIGVALIALAPAMQAGVLASAAGRA